MRTLNTYVHVVAVDEAGNNRSQVFGPDDQVPDWAIEAITNPDVWVDEAPPPAPAGEPAPAAEPSPETDPDRPPGNGSRERWAAYAASKGVEVTGTMSRDDIRAAVDRQGSA